MSLGPYKKIVGNWLTKCPGFLSVSNEQLERNMTSKYVIHILHYFTFILIWCWNKCDVWENYLCRYFEKHQKFNQFYTFCCTSSRISPGSLFFSHYVVSIRIMPRTEFLSETVEKSYWREGRYFRMNENIIQKMEGSECLIFMTTDFPAFKIILKKNCFFLLLIMTCLKQITRWK